MGIMISWDCGACGEAETAFAGSGMRPPDSVLQVADSSQRRKLRAMPDLASATLMTWGGLVLHCRHCDTLHVRDGFVLEWPDGRTYEPRFRCGDCRQPLHNAPEGEDGELDASYPYCCRRCGERALRFDYGCWD